MNKIKIAKIALGLSAVMFFNNAMAQTPEEVIKARFPEVAGDLEISENTQYNPKLKNRYRELFYKMNDGLAEIEKVEAVGAAEVPDLTVFETKTLKDMQKAGTLKDLRTAIKAEQHKISNLMREEKYGADSSQCIRLMSMFQEYVKQQAWNDAYNSWTVLFHDFPKSSQNIYSNGTGIVKYKMSQTKGQEQQLWIDTLFMVYDQRIKYFAATSKLYGEAYILGRKGVDQLKYRKDPIEEPYNTLMRAVDLGGKNTELAVLQTAMQSVIGMFTGEKIDASVVVDKYLKLSGIAAEIKNDLKAKVDAASDADKSKLEKQLETASTVQAGIDNLFSTSSAAQCDVLVNAFKGRFSEKPDDVELADKIVKILSYKGCTDNQLYEDCVSKLVESNPTESACAGFANMLNKKGKPDDAITYFEKAISLSTTDTLKSGYNLAISSIHFSKKSYQVARNYARKAIEFNPNNGAAYLIIATCYAGAPVGEDEFERAQTYWVVIDKLQKAKSVDPSVADKAQTLINQYKGHCPKKEEAFMHSVTEGTSITVGGWIGETTTARF